MAESTPPFKCDYASQGQSRCPAWRCDCFIDTYPDDPFGLHPEAFVVGAVSEPESASGEVNTSISKAEGADPA